MRFAGLLLAVLLHSAWLSAQLPPSEKLTPEDDRAFRNELERLEALLLESNNKPAVRLQIANTYAAGGQYAEAIQRLRNLAAANFGFEPSRDPDFAKLRGTAEFQSIMNLAHRQMPPVHNSRLVATLRGADVRPENIAFDAKRNAFVLGDTREFQLIRCSRSGGCVPFVTANPEEKSYVLGLKIDPRGETVWATDNRPGSAGLRCYDLETGKLLRTAALSGKHLFNDVAVSLSGAVYVTDTVEGSVYELTPGATTLHRLAPQDNFTAANGIALSADGMLLYVSAWEDGIDVIDLRSGAVAPLRHPNDLCLAFVDGLYATQRSLVAIQNGPMLPRIVEFRMSTNHAQITAMRILERRNPAFDGITTGVIVGRDLYYVANPQTDKQANSDFRALQIFSLPVSSR